MFRAKTKLKCPHCDGETVREWTDETCDTCGTTMQEWQECQCCGEFSIKGEDGEDYCDNCKNSVQKKLYDFLKENFTEKEIDVLDEVVDEKLYWFMKEYEEKENER